MANNNSLTYLMSNAFNAFIKLVADFYSLMMTEAILARQSIKHIVLLLIILIPLLITFWFSLIGLFFIILQWFSFSWQFSILALSLFNLILLISVIYTLISLKNSLFFSETRHQLKKLIHSEENKSC